MMGGTVVLSIVLAVAVFMMLPYYLSTLFQKVITSQWVIALLEGSDPSGDFHRICSTYLSDEGYPACLYVPWCRT